MKSAISLIILILFSVLFLNSCGIPRIPPEFPLPETLFREGFSGRYAEEGELCLRFIEEKMHSKSGGIYTNYLEQEEWTELAGGHQILSESEGLIMLFYVKNGDKPKFDRHLDFLRRKMLTRTGLIKWRVDEKNRRLTDYSATIDDLRIIRSLIYAYYRWRDYEYYEVLDRIQRALLKRVSRDGLLANFYIIGGNARAQEINLCYLDLYTMRLLGVLDPKWTAVYEKSLEIIENGLISPEFPLYKKVYLEAAGLYDDSPEINIIDSLLVVLHLSEVGLAKKETIDWLRKQVTGDYDLHTAYNAKTGTPLNQARSTAAYAIAARIARNIGDNELYDELLKRMLTLQIREESSELYGAFGEPRSLTVYSFDNLQALLAF